MRPTPEQLAIINSRLPGTKVTADQVEILPFMAFDNRQTDRFTVATQEFLRAIERDLNNGKVAFNELHKSQTTLPMGRSVNGKFDRKEDGTCQVLANMYAVVKRPDGTTFEDAKTVADKFNTGAVYACSAGVYVDFYKCTICGNDIRDWQKCEHIPGRMYSVDEQPKQCLALMTGRVITDGVAEKCGAYELSAVTAGGVANAGVLTERFERYNTEADLAEFKKTAFGDDYKTVTDRLVLYAEPAETFLTQEETMDEAKIKGMVESYSTTLVEAKVKAETELAALKAQFTSVNEELSKLREAFAVAEETTKTVKAEFEAANVVMAELKTENETLKAYQAEYEATVGKIGTALGKPETEYTGKTLDELKKLHEQYRDELNKVYAVGRQTLEDTAKDAGNEFAGIPEELFKC